jgi:hypothetical protein
MRRRTKTQLKQAEKQWDSCECAEYLLKIERCIPEIQAKIRETNKAKNTNLIPIEALCAFTVVFRLRPKDETDYFFALAIDTPLPSNLPMPNIDDSSASNPLVGEVSARMFLREVFFTIEDMKLPDAGLGWTFVEHGALMQEAWNSWKSSVWRNLDGLNYSDAATDKLKQMEHPSSGGKTRAQNQKVATDAKYAHLQRQAAALPDDMTKSAKAQNIARAEAKKGGTPLSVERIRRII